MCGGMGVFDYNLSLWLFNEEHLSDSGEKICAFSTGNLPLLNLSSNSVARIPDRPFIALVQ